MSKPKTKGVRGMAGPRFHRSKLTYVSPLSLKPAPGNPRVHSPRQVQKIACSIDTFGFNAPLLVDRNGQLIAGHGRWMAAKALGLEQVPSSA